MTAQIFEFSDEEAIRILATYLQDTGRMADKVWSLSLTAVNTSTKDRKSFKLELRAEEKADE